MFYIFLFALSICFVLLTASVVPWLLNAWSVFLPFLSHTKVIETVVMVVVLFFILVLARELSTTSGGRVDKDIDS